MIKEDKIKIPIVKLVFLPRLSKLIPDKRKKKVKIKIKRVGLIKILTSRGYAFPKTNPRTKKLIIYPKMGGVKITCQNRLSLLNRSSVSLYSYCKEINKRLKKMKLFN